MLRRRWCASWCIGVVSLGVATIAIDPAIPTAAPDAAQLSHFELEALRQGLRVDILPDDEDLHAMLRAGREYVFAMARMCIDPTGAPTDVELIERSGFAGYDGKLVSKMRTWRYSPVLRDGAAVAACAPVAFMYHPAIQLVTGRDSGKLAAFTGRELFPSVSGSGVKASYEGASVDVRLAEHDDMRPVDGKPVNVRLSNYATFDLMLWAKPGDLAAVVRETVLLAPTADAVGRGAPEDAPGVRISRGTPVRVVGRKSLVKVKTLDADGITGWIHPALIGKSYRRYVDAFPHTGQRFSLKGKTPLLDKPGGKVLLKLRARDERYDAAELERRGDDVLVVVNEQKWWAVGWVDAQALQPPVEWRASSFRDSGRASIKVSQGTLVFDKPHGKAIGRANRSTHVEVLQVSAGHTQLDIEMDGLHIAAWVVTPPGAVQP